MFQLTALIALQYKDKESFKYFEGIHSIHNKYNNLNLVKTKTLYLLKI